MFKHAAALAALLIIAGTSFIAYAIHDVVEIPPDLAGVGHYEKMPMADGGDLRHFITSHQPYKKWANWPGKDKMREGKEPHGHYITVYINDKAADSLKEHKEMANNSIVIKENYNKKKELAAVTVMYKIKGYNPEGGDWFWAKYDHKFKVLADGKLKGCLDCHSTARDNDFIFTKN